MDAYAARAREDAAATKAAALEATLLRLRVQSTADEARIQAAAGYAPLAAGPRGDVVVCVVVCHS